MPFACGSSLCFLSRRKLSLTSCHLMDEIVSNSLFYPLFFHPVSSHTDFILWSWTQAWFRTVSWFRPSHVLGWKRQARFLDHLILVMSIFSTFPPLTEVSLSFFWHSDMLTCSQMLTCSHSFHSLKGFYDLLLLLAPTYMYDSWRVAATYYNIRFGMKTVAYKGLESGDREVVSHVVRKNKVPHLSLVVFCLGFSFCVCF